MACVRSMRHGIRPRPASYQRFTGEKVAEPDYGFGGGICVRWLARHPAAHVTPGGVDLSETSGIAPWRDFGAPGGQGAALRYPLRRTAYDAPSDTATCRPSGRHVYGMIPGPRRFALSTRWQRIPRRVDAPRTDGGRVRCLRRPGDPFTGSAVPIARRLPTRRASDGRCGDVGGTLTRHRGGGHEGLRRHGSRHFGSCERQFSRRRKRQLVSPQPLRIHPHASPSSTLLPTRRTRRHAAHTSSEFRRCRMTSCRPTRRVWDRHHAAAVRAPAAVAPPAPAATAHDTVSAPANGGEAGSTRTRAASRRALATRVATPLSSRPIPLSTMVARTRATRTPRKFGTCPSFKGHVLSPRAKP
jgi:hypothetical protein